MTFDHTAGQWQRDKTHCPRGHSYDVENTLRNAKGARMCRICRREQGRKAYQKRREHALAHPRFRVLVSPADPNTCTPEVHSLWVPVEHEGIPGTVDFNEVYAALWHAGKRMADDGVARDLAWVSVDDGCICIGWPVSGPTPV